VQHRGATLPPQHPKPYAADNTEGASPWPSPAPTPTTAGLWLSGSDQSAWTNRSRQPPPAAPPRPPPWGQRWRPRAESRNGVAPMLQWGTTDLQHPLARLDWKVDGRAGIGRLSVAFGSALARV